MSTLLMIDGADGTGKTTTVETVVDMLKVSGITAAPVSAFGGPGGAELRLQVQQDSVSPDKVTELILSSLESVCRMVNADRGDCVYVMDRSIVSTMAQQGMLDSAVEMSASQILCTFMGVLREMDMTVGLLLLTANDSEVERRLGLHNKDPLEAKYSVRDRAHAYAESFAIAALPHSSGDDPKPKIIYASWDTTHSSTSHRLYRNKVLSDLLFAVVSCNA